jgi:flagellar protein FlaG
MDVENLNILSPSYPAATLPSAHTKEQKIETPIGGHIPYAADKIAETAKDGAMNEDEKFHAAVKDAVEKANKELKTGGRRLSYSVHEKTHKVMVSVINTDTDEVIREIPPKSFLDSYAKMLEMAGLIVDERG